MRRNRPPDARDLEWMARVKRGDQEALAELIQAPHQRVVLTVSKMLGSETEAEDAEGFYSGVEISPAATNPPRSSRHGFTRSFATWSLTGCAAETAIRPFPFTPCRAKTNAPRKSQIAGRPRPTRDS